MGGITPTTAFSFNTASRSGSSGNVNPIMNNNGNSNRSSSGINASAANANYAAIGGGRAMVGPSSAAAMG